MEHPPINPPARETRRPVFSDVVARIVACAIAALFASAAWLKLSTPSSFLAVVAYLLGRSVPLDVARACAGLVIVWEVLLAAAILLCPRDRRVIGAVIGTLVAFSAALVWLGLDPSAPSCSCFGPFDAAKRAGIGLWTGLVRNAALVVPLLWLWSRAPGVGRSSRSTAPSPTPAPPASDARRAFTLVEVLVVIAIVALVMSLLVPSIRHARHEALYATTSSNQRQLLAGLSSYASDHAGMLPFLGTPAKPFEPITVAGRPFTRQGFFFDHRHYWSTAVNPSYVGLPDVALACPRGLSPHDTPLYLKDGVLSAPRYCLTDTALAAPAFWRERTGDEQPPDLSLLRGQRLADIMAPASKGLVFDVALGYLNPVGDVAYRPFLPTGWGDGSSSTLAVRQADPGSYVHAPPLGALGSPVSATRDGLSGRDR